MMKQTLLKTIALGLMAMVGVNAWADRDENKPVYCPQTDGSYETLLEAQTAITAKIAEDASIEAYEIQLWGNTTMGSNGGSAKNCRINCPSGKTLSIVPKADDIVITKGDHNRSDIWFLNGVDTGTFNIGSSDHMLTIQGLGSGTNKDIMNAVCKVEKEGIMNLTNITFDNFVFSSAGSIYTNNHENDASSTKAFVVMTDIVVNNCSTSNSAFIINNNTSKDDVICLKGKLDFTGCTGTHISMQKRIKLGDRASNDAYSGFTASTPITINWTGAMTYGTAVIVKVPSNDTWTSYFTMKNETLGLFRNNNDLKIRNEYTLNVTDAGAATLVLPFESTIPGGLSDKVYKLDYTSGDNITATAESTTLAADKAVLVAADAGTYKFISTATSGSLATGSGQTSAYGVLIGNYTATTAETPFYAPKDSYILTNHSSSVAFRKVAANNTNKVGAYRAYMSVTHDPALAREFLGITFDNDVTGVNSIKAVTLDNSAVYNLQGVRMTGGNLPKGIYVKNGKKFVIK